MHAVLFDVYETLVDVGEEARARTLDELGARLGLGLGPGELHRRRAEVLGTPRLRFDDGPFRPFHTRWADDGERLFGPLGVTGGGAPYVEAWDGLHISAPPFPDARPALAALRGRYRVGAVADADIVHVAGSLRAFEDLLDVVVCSEDVGAYKPEPAAFLRACELLDVRPERCVFVGDRPEADIGGAAGVGMRTVWINRRGHTWPSDVAPPDATITTLASLDDALRRIAGVPG